MEKRRPCTSFHEKVRKFFDSNDNIRNFYEKHLSEIVNNDKASCQLLAEVLLQLQYTETLVHYFKKELLCILHSAIDLNAVNNTLDNEQHVINCIVLSKIIKLHPDVENFVYKYFNKYSSPFEYLNTQSYPKKKRLHKNSETRITDLDIVNACHAFLQCKPDFFRQKWNWSSFVQKYFEHNNDLVKWTCCQCMAIVLGMNEKQLNALLSHRVTKDDAIKFAVQNDLNTSKTEKELNIESNIDSTNDFISESFLSKQLTFVGDLFLPIYDSTQIRKTNIIEVESTKNNLRRISLGIAAKKAVCLLGAVGSGKSSLIEHLAAKTGRVLGDSFVKLQLGDQTDSKMLLGNYRCTDVPGEFVWQPGVLTQAVIDGSWLLLEDIDSASTDIASVLASLLETKSLTVPSCDNITVNPDFQLFVTQRLIPTMTGYHKKHTAISDLLEKHMLQVNIDPLTPTELVQIISQTHPKLKTIAERMVDVFLYFTNRDERNFSRSNRLISTRDLFKWCARATLDFDVSSQQSALKILQDAIDVFCCSYSDSEQALNLAKKICSHLGIINEKADYFLKNHKPQLSLTSDYFRAGRVSLKRNLNNEFTQSNAKFCFTRQATVLLERTACCVSLKEPVLFVGETGTGKTTSVQYLAEIIGQKLIVINMNQQSDSADLLGGYKPVDMKFICGPIRQEFENVFRDYFDVTKNEKFLRNISYCFNEQKWNYLMKLMRKSYEAAIERLSYLTKPKIGEKRVLDKFEKTSEGSKDKVKKDRQFLERWKGFGEKLEKLESQIKHKNSLPFAFIEGSLVNAVENGYWVLLDEINLANAETLECLSGLLESTENSLSLLERGDKKPVKRHPNFTLFACMNPSTDVGKKDLPNGLRNRFTELFVDELTDKSDLILLVSSYLEGMSLSQEKIENIVKFYTSIRKEAQMNLSDDLGHKPHFSLRSLCRALRIAGKNPCGCFNRSLYEAFCLSFLTQLDLKSYCFVENMIAKYISGSTKVADAILKQPIPEPKSVNGKSYFQFEGYWVPKGTLEPEVPKNYILTQSVRRNLKDLVRIVSLGKLPILLQGDTSVGKTSLITYLAKSSGNKCLRINNHEHTDLQEYIGSYIADSEGKLVFKEGLLVEAMRKGFWIILDELNLAPSDVLEALNRVLDDNQELFIPETQEIVKAHENFMLFATQNPPGVYGGRKMLSRAFRNRFIELHFNEIPSNELEVILGQRCEMPGSYAKKVVEVMKQLQIRRRESAAFAGKYGFMTLRDLFRWGERYRLATNKKTLYDWDQHLADEGYLVLAGKVRRKEEKNVIIQVLKKVLKRDVVPNNLFTLSEKTSTVTRHILEQIQEKSNSFPNFVWTYNMRQTAVLMRKAQEFCEPVLLVGETGGGKTTLCEILANMNGQRLATVNCHMHTESGDFIGGLHPVRDHSGDNLNKLFEWLDGPLILSMKAGDVFLADEISLADDSVLERLNSLLEPERTLLIAEKAIALENGGENSELVIAHENFRFVGTMNPGGDYGKKELSPALRNRLTEIWCETCSLRGDFLEIVGQNLKITGFGEDLGSFDVAGLIMDFVEFFKDTAIGKRYTISVRDILTWVNFINICGGKIGTLKAYVHGAYLTFLDSLGSGTTSTENAHTLTAFEEFCLDFLKCQVNLTSDEIFSSRLNTEIVENLFGISPFYVEIGENLSESSDFSFAAPTTSYNALRLLRGMQLRKPILLEGSPGVGKTSLVMALAKASGHGIFRVNLSDQTDISDLFGADLPVEGATGGHFEWRDGPLLQALKKGHWILLDELNLASQSVLEGLNACLDHRGEIFIPELGKTFHVTPGTRFFGCQNPMKQGGSRRGLPQSFLNRFVQVHIRLLNNHDYFAILQSKFPQIPHETLQKMIEFNAKIQNTQLLALTSFEFNLRDLSRWCEAASYYTTENAQISTRKTLEKDTQNLPQKPLENGQILDQKTLKIGQFSPESTVELVYCARLRSGEDRARLREMFEEVFGREVAGDRPTFYVNHEKVFVGDVSLKRGDGGVNVNVLNGDKNCLVLRKQLGVLRSLMYCVNLNWMSILVGKSGSGKTSVVKTLANIAGKPLRTFAVTSAMDTTDILGGFEQTDYTRHSEEVQRQIEQLLLEVLQKLLIEENTQRAVELLMKWESYKELQGFKSHASQILKEQTELFINRLQKLMEIVELLQKHNGDDQLTAINERLEKLLGRVKADRNLNAGGQFEWVDSILVKCLQEGSWLLIDNVNLCSPAVLDRLNALLEPNGELAIGERGVDQNGKIFSVKPHKDFRLFLTMDPKYGEMSRAMRNRGIEMFMLDTDENEYDLKSLITSKGLQENNYICAVLKIHEFIRDLVIGEKPNNTHLLQSVFLINEQIQRGVNLRLAFNNAIEDVYCKSRSQSDFNTNDSLTIIKTQIKQALSTQEKQIFSSDMTIKPYQLQNNCDLEKIKQQTALLKCLKSNGNTRHLLFYGFIQSCSICSPQDFKIREILMKNILKDEIDVFKNIFDLLNTALLRQTDESLPLDFRWLPDVYYKDKQMILSNKLFLQMYYRILKEILEKSCYSTKRDRKDKLMIEYLKEVQQNKMEVTVNEPVVVESLNLMEYYENYLKNIVANEQVMIDDQQLIEILFLVRWSFSFYKCTFVNIRKINSAQMENILQDLNVNYKWFVKNSVKRVGEIAKLAPNKNLQSIIQKIDSSLINKYSVCHKLAKKYLQLTKPPPPLVNQIQLEILPVFNALVRKFDVYDSRANLERILSISKIEKDLRLLFVNLKMEFHYCFEKPPADFEKLTSIVSNYKNKEIEEICDKYEVILLPIFDYFIQLILLKVRCNRNLENHENLLKNAITIPSNLSGTLLRYNKEKDKRLLQEISTEMHYYLLNSACCTPEKFLNFKSENGQIDSLNLSHFGPVLSSLVTEILVSEENKLFTALGEYRSVSKQRRALSVLLWQNMEQLSNENYDKMSNEMKYVCENFELFIYRLSQALSTNSPNFPINMPEKIQWILTTLEEFYSKFDSQDTSKDKETLILLLKSCFAEITNLQTENLFSEKGKSVANVYLLLGYLKAFLSSKISFVDRLKKISLKKKYCLEDIENGKNLLNCYEMQNEVYSDSKKTIHAYCESLEVKIQKLLLMHAEYEKYVAVRPKDLNYESLAKVISYAFSTVLATEKMSELFTDLNILENNKERIVNQQSLKKLSVNVASYQNFITEISKYRFAYPDIVEPLLSSIMEFLYGIKLKIESIKSEIQQRELQIDLRKFVINLVKFPVLDNNQSSYQEHIRFYSGEKMFLAVQKVLKSAEMKSVEQLRFRLIMCGMQEIYNLVALGSDNLNASLHTDFFTHFSELLSLFVQIWNRQEEERELKKKEAESLYKIKTKCDVTEEEELENEFKSLFPNFQQKDFNDIQKQIELTDDDDLELPEIKEHLTVSQKDVAFVIKLHQEFLTNYTKTEWINNQKKMSVDHDFVLPLLEKLKLYKMLLNKSGNVLDYRIDAESLGSLNVLIAVAENYGKTDIAKNTSPTRNLTREKPNFYKDSNIEEVKSSYHILAELKQSVSELLNQWPDHPSLKTIILVIDRIYSFSIASPLSRFLTGFEILLAKCNEWEEVAHSGVSLSQHELNVTQQIISWRKLELNMWRDCLNLTFERMNEDINKWWLCLYNIMKEFLLEKSIRTEDLISSLQRFVTQSTLAEFENRLKLLYVFHCHSTNLNKTTSRDTFMNILWNIYQYYSQFLPNVLAKIKEIRAPIEKKLKDYVKIVQWKDINYWAIKDKLQKTHKTLHKHMREFQNLLSQSVTNYLVNYNGKESQNVGIWDRPQRHVPKEYHYTIDSSFYVVKQSPTKGDVLSQKNHKYFSKARILCKSVIDEIKYPTLIKDLEGFLMEIVDTSQHLQNLEVDSTLPKKKQVSQAKSILQQKRRALADLFKHLTKIGLSYKTGLVNSKNKTTMTEFLIKPIDLNAVFASLNNNHNKDRILTIWEGCEMYYLKSLMRLNILETALNSPDKSLGLQNIERIRGFGIEFLTIVHAQKEKLIESSRSWYYTKYYTKCFENFCEGKHFINVNILENFEKFLLNVLVVTAQFKLVLQTCPEETDLANDFDLQIPILNSDNNKFPHYKNNDSWNKSIENIMEITNLVQKLFSLCKKIRNDVPSVEYDLVNPQYLAVSDFNLITDGLRSILNDISEICDIFGEVPFVSSFSWLLQEAKQLQDKLINSQNELNTEFGKATFKNLAEKLSEQILLSVQNIYKKYCTGDEQITEEQENSEEYTLHEQHLKGLIVDKMFGDISLLQMKSILKLCGKASQILVLHPAVNTESREELLRVVPLLEQATLLQQYFLTQQVASYRVTCKMSSILLNVFIDLATKGFCVPPELSDDMETDAEGKPSDGLGLGDGKGERDVSDKIESEDQLEEAKPAGEEKQKEDDDDCKEEEKGIEMSEDFDSKLQDVKENEENSDDNSSDSEAEEQMGETEKGADKLDKQIWDADEEDPENDSEQKEEDGTIGEQETGKELAANEKAANQPKDDEQSTEKTEENKDDINKIKEPEFDDDQVDPYHGNQPELPEPEPMDLPEDVQLSDDENDEETQDENPFDIDKQKEEFFNEENNKDEKKEMENEKDNENGENSNSESDGEENDNGEGGETGEVNTEDEKSEDVEENSEGKKNVSEDSTANEDVKDEENELFEGSDEKKSDESEAQPMEVDENKSSADNVKSESIKHTPNEENDATNAENAEDVEGTGQAENEDKTEGHSGDFSENVTQQNASASEPKKERSSKPGESDSKRSLGDVDEPVKKKLKTVNANEKQSDTNEEGEKDVHDPEMVQHIEEAKDAAHQILDTANKEQTEKQKKEAKNMEVEEEKKEDEIADSSADLPVEESVNDSQDDVEKLKPEKSDANKDKKQNVDKNKGQHPEGDVVEQMETCEIEGENVLTSTVQRGNESTHHVQYGELQFAAVQPAAVEEIDHLRADIEKQLAEWQEQPSDIDATTTWHKISAVTSTLAQDLSEQLRLILEPTRASQLKGDFRTGKRINMRKVIPYIASQFRKDKIWLRRTKPSKREYQIVLAIDDSSSMADNKSKEMAFESVALISKALSLLESGNLSVLSFGEETEIIHKLSDPFTEKSGSNLLQKFKFLQKKTCVANLVNFVNEMLNSSFAERSSDVLAAKLLIIISDGRLSTDNTAVLQQAVRRAKLANVFMIFVIIDNPNNKDSILDIRKASFKDGKCILESYMDHFPFPFYIVLKDIGCLPGVLSDALRQWFEIVSNVART